MQDVICIYGVGSGELYLEFKEWLSKSKGHYLVFLEEDEEVYASLFREPLLQDPQVKVYFITPENENEIFKQIAWEFVFVPFSYKPHPQYALTRAERAAEVFAKMGFFQSGVELLASDYSDCGVKILNNVRHNTSLLPHASRGLALHNAFQGIPAIICGGGPSLMNNIEQLKELGDKALIFAGGAALTILQHHGVRPHFGAGIDPGQPPASHLSRTHFELPFFYQDRVSPQLLNLCDGPLLWMPDVGGYPLERCLIERLGLSEHPFDAGWTVGNFLTTISQHLGCNPIIFVGMDLSAGKERLYAPGVDKRKEEERLILVHDAAGNPFYSRRDWVMSAQWTEALALSHPNTRFFNATEGGIGFKGIEDVPLNVVVEEHCKTAYDLQAKIHAHLQLIEKMKVPTEEVSKYWQEVDGSLARCQEKCRLLLDLIGQSYPESPFNKGIFILHQFELSEELVYTRYLEPLWNIWQYVFKRNMSEAMGDEIGAFVNKILFFQNAMKQLDLFRN